MDITKDLAEHLGLALAVAGSTFVAVRLWAVAHFDTTTALAILAEQGTSTVVGGTLIYLLSYVPFVIAVFLAGALGVSPKKKRVYLQLSVAGAILGSFFIPWPIAVVFFLCWAILIWTGLTSSRDMQAPEGDVDEEKSKSKPEKKSVPRSHLRGAVIFGLGLWLLIDATLWLPPENVEIRGVEQPLTAYVLNDDSAVLVLLAEPERRLVRLPTSMIKSRQFCRGRPRSLLPSLPWAESWNSSRTLVSLLVSPPKYPKCIS